MEATRVDYSDQRVLAIFRRDELQQEILAPHTDTSRDHGLEERIAQLTQEDLVKVLKWALNKGLLRNPTVSRLENMVTRLSEENRAELLEWAVEGDNMSDPMIIWLEGMGAQLSKKKLADLLERKVRWYSGPTVTWLEDKGARLNDQTLCDLLEEMTLRNCRPNEVTLRWLEGLPPSGQIVSADTLAEVFSDNTSEAQWLLQRGAQLKPHPTMLTVLYRQYRDSQPVECFTKTCSREDL
ncbi:hypothetical protein LTR81_027959, partial [Elasticomyces elasticus]